MSVIMVLLLLVIKLEDVRETKNGLALNHTAKVTIFLTIHRGVMNLRLLNTKMFYHKSHEPNKRRV